MTQIVKSTLGHERMPRNLLLLLSLISGVAAGGFRVDSPVKNPAASEIARSSPPYTDRAIEKPWDGGERTAMRHLTIGRSEIRVV